MKTKYVALSTACKDLFCIVDMVRVLGDASSLSVKSVNNLCMRVHENYVGACMLAGLKPCLMTPHLKHYAIKYHWFWEHVQAQACHVTLFKIATQHQLGDLVTKASLLPPLLIWDTCVLVGNPCQHFKRECKRLFMMHFQLSNLTSFLLGLCRHFTVFSSTSDSCLRLTIKPSLEGSSFLQSLGVYMEST